MTSCLLVSDPVHCGLCLQMRALLWAVPEQHPLPGRGQPRLSAQHEPDQLHQTPQGVRDHLRDPAVPAPALLPGGSTWAEGEWQTIHLGTTVFWTWTHARFIRQLEIHLSQVLVKFMMTYELWHKKITHDLGQIWDPFEPDFFIFCMFLHPPIAAHSCRETDFQTLSSTFGAAFLLRQKDLSDDAAMLGLQNQLGVCGC